MFFYDHSTEAYFLPGKTECKYKNTKKSIKSWLKYTAKIRIFLGKNLTTKNKIPIFLYSKKGVNTWSIQCIPK